MADAVFYAPGIPKEKLESARAVHALHLPEEEAVLVLYDNTLFGSAEDGFLITEERLCWRNLWEHPRQIPWSDIDPSSITRASGEVGVAGGSVLVSAEIVQGTAAFFSLMSVRRSASEAGPYRIVTPHELPVDGVITLERLLSLTRSHVGEVNGLYLHPSIPAGKLETARATHADHLPEDEEVAVLFDDTVFGSAKEGFLLTSRRLCWKNISARAQALAWGEIASEMIMPDKGFVCVMNGAIQVTARAELIWPVVKLLRAVVEEAKGGRV